MVENKSTATKLAAQSEFDLASFVKNDEPPFCPQSGQACVRRARSNMWVCESSNYSIPIASWDIVLMHSGVALQHFRALNIEQIVYNGVPIHVQHAVSPSHLLPLIALRCMEIASATGLGDSFMLTLASISEEAESSGNTLLPEMVTTSNVHGSLSESLQILIAAIEASVKNCREENPITSLLDYRFLLTDQAGLDLVG